jgi:choline kinase
VQAPIIATFHCPAENWFRFERFYRGLVERGFLIYPGKLSHAEKFSHRVHRRDRAGRFPAAADRNSGGGRRDEARAAAGTSRIIAMTAVPARDIAVVLLAAGVGRRLGDATPGPKVLLEFSGQTLLERHLRTLMSYGIDDIGLTVGYQSDAIRREVARLGLEDRVRLIPNPDFRKGSLVSLSVQGDRLRGGRPVMLMDGDVLYDPAMIGRLLAATGENILLMDRDIEPGDEPVKICLSGERIVDFRKKPEHAHDRHGESVGFFRFSAATAAALAERCGQHVAEGRSDLEYEEAIRDLILAEPERFAVADIGGIPWIEIDFGDDVTRARETIMPRLEPCP